MTGNTRESREKLICGFYPIVDVNFKPDSNPYELTEEVLSKGFSLIQYRHKNISEEEYLNWARQIYYLKIHNDFKFIVNHFINVAKKLEADGIHLTSNSVSVLKAREILGENILIGASVHSVEEGIQKAKEGADYLTFGCIFKSDSKKPDHPVLGLEKLSELCQSVLIPVVAIGGITEDKIDSVLKTGAKAYTSLSDFYKKLS